MHGTMNIKFKELISCNVVDSRIKSGTQHNFVFCNKVYTIKGKAVSVMKTYGGVETWLHSSQTSTLHSVSGQLYGPAAFRRCNRPRHSLNRRLRRFQTRPGRFGGGGGKTNLLPLPKIERFLGSPAHYSVSLPTTLFQRHRYLKLAVYPADSQRAATKFGTELVPMQCKKQPLAPGGQRIAVRIRHHLRHDC